MKILHAIGRWAILLLLATAGCSPNPDSEQQSEKGGRFNQARVAKGIQRYQANQHIDEAQKAIQASDEVGLARAIVELNRLGDEAVELLVARAADVSRAKQDRIAALTALGKMELLTPGVDARLESISKEDADVDIKAAATKALANARGDK